MLWPGMRYLICQISIDIANFMFKSVKMNYSYIIVQENGVKLIIQYTSRVCALVHIYAAYNSDNSKHAHPASPAKCGCRAFVRSCRVEFDIKVHPRVGNLIIFPDATEII